MQCTGYLQCAGFRGIAERSLVGGLWVSPIVAGLVAITAHVLHHTAPHALGIVASRGVIRQVSHMVGIAQEGGLDNGGGYTGVVAGIHPPGRALGVHSQDCTRLTTVEFAKNSVMTTMQGYVFATCNAVKSITLPNSVTTVHGRAFQGMKGLEYANLGANVRYLTKPSSGEQHFSLFYECTNLKTVVIPGTLLPENVDANGWGLQVGFPSGTPTIIYTGTLENLLAIQAKFKKYGDNGAFTGATVENGRLVIADHCETFYGGHAFAGEDRVSVQSYLEAITVGDYCKQCKKATVKETINPIFTWIGYSACTYGEGLSMTQGYRIDNEAAAAFLEYVPDFDFGIIATVNKSGEAIAPKLGDAGVLTGEFVKDANNYLDIKIKGIPTGHEDTLIVFCAYVIADGEIYYIDNEASGSSVLGVSYNDVLKMNG